MIIQLNTTSATPIYVQLRNQIVMGIGRGDLKIGEGLPTVRQMAQDIGVNTLTVQKSYEILKNEGYIEIDRRHGAKVSPKADASTQFSEAVESRLTLLVAESSLKGITRDDFMSICSTVYNNLNVSYVGGMV
jgi:DNA-binding transcriptional regulator YhcF (GntR family)